MATVKVYRYDYFDRLLKRDRRSVDFATADAIAQMGATILAESERLVDDEMLDESGMIRAADMPPRGELRWSPVWRRPGAGPRLGAR